MDKNGGLGLNPHWLTAFTLVCRGVRCHICRVRDPAIQVEQLSKTFDDVIAVDRVTFSVGRGETVALLGGNGAGKTTTISILLGLLLPTSGRARVLGADMARRRHQVLGRINFSSPYVDLPRRLTVEQNLMVYSHLYDVTSPRRRIAQLADDLDLGPFLKRPTGKLSAGQSTRVALAKALLNRPEVLLLDEPTASLDPDTADWVRGYLQAYQRRSGAAVLLASHNMVEVERLCDQVLMMRRGRIANSGTPRQLLERHGRGTLEEVFLDIARAREGEEAPLIRHRAAE